jgi:thiol-disulfide isomerase/thioredoxin
MRRITAISLGAWLAMAMVAPADEVLPTLKVGDKVYQQVTVTKVTATDIYFVAADGMGNVKLKNLDPELQRHFNYDPDKAAAQEQKLKDDAARYHAAVLHDPPSVAATRDGADKAGGAQKTGGWGTDIPAAFRQARSEHKNVLLDFTGSDWCPWCIKFDEDVLKQEAFMSYAETNLVLVRVDFPRHTELPPELKAANDAASKRFNVDGFPTYILLSPDGKELGRQVGYREGGPAAFTSELDGYAAAH